MITLNESEKRELQRLKDKILNGNIALFLGAGASLSSGAPSGAELVDKIKTEFNDIDFTDIGSNLLDICQEIEEEGRRPEIDRYINGLFYGLKPKNSHLSLPRYPWPVMFTTNYDDLIEKSFEEFFSNNGAKARKCIPIIRGDRTYNLNRKSEEVLLFKIMGDFKRDDDEQECPVITRREFNARSPSRNKMLEILSSFVHDGEILYVGYSFRDKIIFEVIDEILKQFGNKVGNSYALIPYIEKGSRAERNLTSKRIISIPISFEDFIGYLDTNSPEISFPTFEKHTVTLRLRNGDFHIPYNDLKDYEEYFHIVSDRDFQSKNSINIQKSIRSFLEGRSEDGEPFEKDWDFKRDAYYEVKDRLASELKKTGPEDNDAILIEGGGGLGKSILLRRLAYDFYREGVPVIILNSQLSFFDYPLINKFCSQVNKKSRNKAELQKIIIILDNAAANIDHIKKLSVFLKNKSKPVIILGATRPNEWIYAQSQWNFKNLIPENRKVELSQYMNDDEAKRLIEHIGKLLGIEEYISNKDLWADYVKDHYDNDFFYTIYGLLDPARRRLDEILWDEYKKLPSEPTKRAYEYVCLFYQYDLPLRLEMIVRPLEEECNYSYRQFAEEIYKKEAKSLIIEMDGKEPGDLLYRAKNRLIAQKIVEKIFDPYDSESLAIMIERYVSVLSKIKLLDKDAMDTVRALLVKYIGPNGIDPGKIVGENLVRLYDCLLDNGIEDGTILHHYGIFERNRENFEKAEKLLFKAKSVTEKNIGGSLGTEPLKNILNSLGVLYSKMALKFEQNRNPDSSSMYYDKANFYFKQALSIECTNSYVFHSQAHSSYLRGKYYEETDEKLSLRYYSEAIEVIQRAKESLPDYELGPFIDLESKIYGKEMGKNDIAKRKLEDFIFQHPGSIHGYVLLSRLIYDNASKIFNKIEEFIPEAKLALSYVEKGLKIDPKNVTLLRTKYYIIKKMEPNNYEKLYDLLYQRYKSYGRDCTELRLIFDLAVITFEKKDYQFSSQLFSELDNKAFNSPLRSGIVEVARDLTTLQKKWYQGYVSKYITRKEAYIRSTEIPYLLKFLPQAQHKEVKSRDDVEFYVTFNYRGPLAYIG